MKVKIDVFEGPLDLLLYLVKKNHIDIKDLPVAQITEQYLEYLEWMRSLDINVASEYLVLAATLIHIKSRMLLPQPQEAQQEQEEDPREMLINRLLEYQKYKEAVKELRRKAHQQEKVFMRQEAPRFQTGFFEASIFDLISALRRVLKDVPREVFLEVIRDEYTIEDKIRQINSWLLEAQTLTLSEIFSRARDRIEIVAFFLAILELMRLREIIAIQKELFGEVWLMRPQNNHG